VLELDAMVFGEVAGGVVDLRGERLGELGEVEDPDALAPEEHLHPRRVADSGQGPLQHDAIEAADDASDLSRASLEDRLHLAGSLVASVTRSPCADCRSGWLSCPRAPAVAPVLETVYSP